MNRIRKVVRACAVATIAVGIASNASVQAQVKIQQGLPQTTPGGINPTPWFSNPEVRQHLNLNDSQYGGLNKAYGSAWANYQKGLNSIDKNLSPAEQQQRVRELQQGFYRNFAPERNKYLTDAAQRQRYEQIQRQYQGFGAFNDPAVADQLKLTPAQRDQLNQHQRDWYAQMNKLGSTYQTDRQQTTGQYTRLQAQNANRINSVLTPEQQAMWGRMIGNPYSFTPDVYFGANAKTIGGGQK
jgi:hypothetical protein